MQLSRGRGRERDERGSTLLFATVFLAVLMMSGAFVVDLGMQRVARADVQAVADVIALDLARQLDGRTVAELEPVLDALSEKSLSRNAGIIGPDAPGLDYELGTMAAGEFVPMSEGVPTAVRVVAQAEVPYAFAGITGENSGTATRSAAAESSSTACFKLGSFVAAIRGGDETVLDPLNDLLGVNLDLVSYRGLADADVRLSQLTANPTIGSPEALLQGSILYSDLLAVMLDALAKESGGNNTVAITALGKLINSSVTTSVGEISLSNVLHISPTDRAALEVEMSVLDLIGSARLSDGQYFVGVPNIQGGVPGVGWQYTGAIYLVSAAELACGAPNSPGATADTAQLDGTLGIEFTNLPSISPPGLGTLQTPKGAGFLEIEAGSGTGALVSPPPVHCGVNTVADPSTFSVRVASALASYKLNANVTVSADVKLTDLVGLGLTSVITNLLGNILLLGTKLSLDVEVTLSVGTQLSPSTSTVGLSLPPNDVTPVTTGGSMSLSMATLMPTVTSVKIGGKAANLASVTAVTNLIAHELVTAGHGFVEKTLTPLVNNINTMYIGPVSRMIGLRLGGADVFAVEATCGRPRLVG
ncbi:pilus assembly protein TadG-related protein [Nocardioides sp. WS12]|uniref:pilus assembly protein TadG-related protein n=1 Tax=Nocardioides sp. WS12 TaxID=2486272 RepID=UPI0015FA7A09|nr:pilus assembly protein TadG-related protein [Nocardioides sp. WS12]